MTEQYCSICQQPVSSVGAGGACSACIPPEPATEAFRQPGIEAVAEYNRESYFEAEDGDCVDTDDGYPVETAGLTQDMAEYEAAFSETPEIARVWAEAAADACTWAQARENFWYLINTALSDDAVYVANVLERAGYVLQDGPNAPMLATEASALAHGLHHEEPQKSLPEKTFDPEDQRFMLQEDIDRRGILYGKNEVPNARERVERMTGKQYCRQCGTESRGGLVNALCSSCERSELDPAELFVGSPSEGAAKAADGESELFLDGSDYESFHRFEDENDARLDRILDGIIDVEPDDYEPAGRLSDALKRDRADTRHGHHLLPQQFGAEFERIGFNIEEYKLILRAQEHRDLHRDGWNELWRVFFDIAKESSTAPTRENVLDYLKFMIEHFDLKYGAGTSSE
jgi:Predicted lipoprotein of unknown function (DUF2380)